MRRSEQAGRGSRERGKRKHRVVSVDVNSSSKSVAEGHIDDDEDDEGDMKLGILRFDITDTTTIDIATRHPDPTRTTPKCARTTIHPIQTTRGRGNGRASGRPWTLRPSTSCLIVSVVAGHAFVPLDGI